jgi:outer membrane protein assembly factor BamB
MRKHPLSPLVCLAAAAAAAGVSVWTSAGCAKKPEYPEPIPAVAPIPLNQFVRSWFSNLDLPKGDAVKEIHPREDKVFVYTRSGQVVAMARDTGTLLWIAQIRATDRGGMRPPVVLKDRIVIPTSSTLELYEPNEGRFLRSVPLKVAARSDAVGRGGDFEGAGRVVALDVSKEYVPTVWQLMIPKGGLQSTPALFEDALFVGGGDGNVYAVAAANREALWPLKDNAFKTEGPIVADLAVDESGVYVPSTDSRLYCLNRATGRLKWQYYAGAALRDAATVTATQVFLPVPEGGIAAFNKGDGEFNRRPLWLAAGMSQFLAEDDKLVYLRRGSDNAIVAVDKQTGEQRFESHRRDLISFATNPKPDGVIFAASKTNRVLAIRPVLRPGAVGEVVWNDADTAPDTAPDGPVATAR